jgi:hypothetical protein
MVEHWVGVVGRSSGCAAAGHSRQSLVADVALEVERRCLRSEERPVITRFWLFEGCAQTLFRWKLMDLPAADVLQTGMQHQRANNQKRITLAQKYSGAEDARFQLALACLRLRWTSLATSTTGQTNRRGASDSAVDAQAGVRIPLMVRLARWGSEREVGKGEREIK